jgi:hypothetical protein
MRTKIIKVIAYKATDGKLFEDKNDALEHSRCLWEERLAAFMGKLKLDDTQNPIKNHTKLMEFMLKNALVLRDIFNAAAYSESEGENDDC